MTDPTHPDDEAISSYLDGEAALDEVARIEADPALLAEAQELGAVVELLSTPVEPLPDADVDRLIDMALDQNSTTSGITDLAAARARHTFTPQRPAAIAAALLILAGAVGALIAFNSNGDEVMSASTIADSAADMAADMADDSFADTPDMAQAMPEINVMADEGSDEEYDEPTDAPGDTSDSEESADWAQRGELDQNGETESILGDDTAEATTTTYHLLDIEIADSYPTFDEFIAQTRRGWQELIAAGATTDPDAVIEPGIAEQALAELPCGQTYIDTFDRVGWDDMIDVSATIVAGTPVTVVVQTSVDTVELLAAAEPDCDVTLLATLTP